MSLGEPYNNIIPEITVLVNKHKRNMDYYLENIEFEINLMNNYFIKESSNNILLKDIWENYYYLFSDNNKYLDYLKNINYFKSFIEIITKMIVYNNVMKYIVIYKNKDETFTYNFDVFYKGLRTCHSLYKILKEFESKINYELNKILT